MRNLKLAGGQRRVEGRGSPGVQPRTGGRQQGRQQVLRFLRQTLQRRGQCRLGAARLRREPGKVSTKLFII